MSIYNNSLYPLLSLFQLLVLTISMETKSFKLECPGSASYLTPKLSYSKKTFLTVYIGIDGLNCWLLYDIVKNDVCFFWKGMLTLRVNS